MARLQDILRNHQVGVFIAYVPITRTVSRKSQPATGIARRYKRSSSQGYFEDELNAVGSQAISEGLSEFLRSVSMTYLDQQIPDPDSLLRRTAISSTQEQAVHFLSSISGHPTVMNNRPGFPHTGLGKTPIPAVP